MKIASVTTTNFKGSTQVDYLRGLDLFVGPNGSGKTRLQQALILALSGAVPHHVDDTNIELLDLFTKSEGVGLMKVGVEFSTGNGIDSIMREFMVVQKDGKDSVKQNITLLPITTGGVQEAERKIKSVIGDFPVMLDLNRFVRMSDAQRQQLIFEFSPISDMYGSDNLVADLVAVLEEIKSDETVARPILSELAGYVALDIRTTIRQVGLWLKDRESGLRKSIKGNAGASNASIQTATTDGKQSLRHVVDIKGDIAKVRDQQRELLGDIAEARNTRVRIKTLEDDKKTLGDRIQAEQTKFDAKSITVLRKKIETAQAALRTIDGGAHERLDKWADEVETRKEKLREMKSRLDKDRANLADATERRDLVKEGNCPVCAQPTKSVIGAFNDVVKNLTAICSAGEDLVDVEVRAINDDILNLNSARKQFEENERFNRQQNDVISIAQRQLSIAEGAAEGVQVLVDRLKELRDTKIEGKSLDVAMAEGQSRGLDERTMQLENELHTKESYDTRVLLAKESALKAKQGEQSLAIIKVLSSKLNEIRREIVQNALEPIRQEASELFALAKQSGEFNFLLVDGRGNDVFKFGWNVESLLGKMFIDFDSLSTAQQLYTLVSLMAPLIHRGSPQLRVLLLDNIEVVDHTNRENFLELLRAAAKYHDNIIVASSAEMPWIDGVTIHQLS